jgi:hypothetical protein
MKRVYLLIAILLLAGTCQVARATTINLSTGQNSGGVIQTADGSCDAFWTAVNGGTNPGSAANACTGGAAQIVLSNDADWFSGWVADNAHSDWIARNASNSNNGTSTYSIVFNLSGYVLSTVSISGSWTLDDQGDLYLNNDATCQISTLGNGNWGGLTAFSFTDSAHSSCFNQGNNTLSVVITSSDDFLEGVNLTGSVSGTCTPGAVCASTPGGGSQVPEPGSLVLFGSGLMGIGGLLRRKFEVRKLT